MILLGGAAFAQEQVDPFEEAAKIAEEGARESDLFLQPGTVRKLTETVKPAVVSVRQIGRDGNQRGIGAGFVIDPGGLVATNFHVIGESRPVEVEFPDGSVFPVTEIHSWDRRFDLAILRIDPKGKMLPHLELGDSSQLKQGQIIVGFGSPLGLEFSVVTGVISAIRKLDADFLGEETPDFPMIQVAMPIEQGNSGGPIVSLDGKVFGVVTLRHRVKANLGFAVRSNDLSSLLENPNPVPMERWKTIGALDPRQWTIVMNGDWSQRGGVIHTKRPGSGFGGRTLCLSQSEVPRDEPYEVAVKVRLDDESGAAGLAFSSDGADRHYGFYPSGGKLRLTRFEGPDVYSWNILDQLEVDSYQPGEWNRLRVRIDGDLITAYVNGKEALSLKDAGLAGGRAGLCKFRQTEAEFRNFQIGRNLQADALTPEQKKSMEKEIARFLADRNSNALMDQLDGTGELGRTFLEEKAREFEELARQMRVMQTDLHRRAVATDLKAALGEDGKKEADLFEVALQLARIDDPELDVDHYRGVFARLADEAAEFVGEEKGRKGVLKLRDFLFKENGFHGSRNEYYHHANSYINHVLDDREGLPITLSVIFIEMARRLKMEGVFGVGLPGQFLVGFQTEPESDLLLINVFQNGKEMTRAEAEGLAMQFGSRTTDATFLPSPSNDIAERMLRNLIGLEINQKENPPGALGYLDLLLAINPDATQARFQRALIQVQVDEFEGAKRDLDWLLENRPEGINYSRLMRFREALP